MIDLLSNINKVFESRIRLGVMSVLMVNEDVDFNSLKEMLKITDGNLASHMSVLEKNKFIKVKKSFIGKKPNTSYSVTDKGRKCFAEHLDALEKIIKSAG